MNAGENSSEPRALRDRVHFLAAVVGVAATVVLALVAYEYQRLVGVVDRQDGIISGIAVSVARSLEHIEEHDAKAEYWVSRIETNTAHLHEIKTSSLARADPFTGTDGDELEKRLIALEQSDAAMEVLKIELKEWRKETQEERDYYRSSVIPALDKIQGQLELHNEGGAE